MSGDDKETKRIDRREHLMGEQNKTVIFLLVYAVDRDDLASMDEGILEHLNSYGSAHVADVITTRKDVIDLDVEEFARRVTFCRDGKGRKKGRKSKKFESALVPTPAPDPIPAVEPSAATREPLSEGVECGGA